MMRTFLALLLVAAAPLSVAATQAVGQAEAVEMTAEIVAIDQDSRLITLEDEDGDIAEIYAGPEVKRFDELKVGDEVTFAYYESIVSQIRKPGDSAPAAPATAAATRGTGPKPSGMLAQLISATVTITAIDANAPSVTVETEDGRTVSFKVADAENLEGVKVGDRVDITYSSAVMITVK